MSGKLALVVGGAVGYVLGTRAGRERYVQIKARARSLWSDPAVQDAVTQAKDKAKETAQQAAGKATGSRGGTSGPTR